jgi:3-deoxy-D-manno-octulosonate 8-phosphate phosphatase (KDO 8-P phosphatase)
MSESLSNELRQRLAAIRLIALDVDGVLTDGRLLISSQDEAKQFSVRDGLGIVLAQQIGLKIALVSGRRSGAVDRRAAEWKIPESLNLSAAGDKAFALGKLKEENGVSTEEVAFVGDDLNDLPAFGEVGLAVAVGDAVAEVKQRAHFVTQALGGNGAVREIIEAVLREQGKWEQGVEAYLAFIKSQTLTKTSVQ